jgi:hypothetical protein
LGTSAHRPFTGGDIRPSTGWHAQLEDVNNDGRYDLFIAKGNIDRMLDFAMKDPSNLLLQNEDGKFEEVGDKANMLNFDEARGASKMQALTFMASARGSKSPTTARGCAVKSRLAVGTRLASLVSGISVWVMMATFLFTSCGLMAQRATGRILMLTGSLFCPRAKRPQNGKRRLRPSPRADLRDSEQTFQKTF